MEETKSIVAIDQEQIIQLLENMDTALQECRKTYGELYEDEATIKEMSDDDVSRFATETNKAIKIANEMRIAFKKSFNEPVKRVEELFKAELDEINALHNAYKAEKNTREEAGRSQRREELKAIYDEFIEANEVYALGESVPFERIENPKWSNKSYGAKKAENELIEEVTRILNEFNSLKKQRLYCEDATYAKFFESLSIRDALEFDLEEADRRAKARAVKQEIEVNQSYMQAEAEEPVHVYAFSLAMTASQKDSLMGFIRLAEIHGNCCMTRFNNFAECHKEVKKHVC